MTRRYAPWVGEHYADGLRDGLSTLIVGESHYDADDDEMLTCKSIEGHLALGPWRFNSAVESIALGLQSSIASSQFWNRVAFCNFVQRLMLTLADRPTSDDGAASWPALRSTIVELRPDVMLVFSRFVWDHSPSELSGEPRVSSRRLPPGDGNVYLYDRNDAEHGTSRPLIVGYFRHPSRLGAPTGVWQVFAEHVWRCAKEEFSKEPSPWIG